MNFWNLLKTLIVLRLIILAVIVLLAVIWYLWSCRRYQFKNTRWILKDQSESNNKLQNACLIWVKNELAILQSWILDNNLLDSNAELPTWFFKKINDINSELEKNNLNPVLREKIKMEIYNYLLARGCGKAAMQFAKKYKISL